MRSAYLRDRCSAVVLDLNNRLTDCRNGSLIQVWLPEVSGNNRTVLSTQGLPYAVAGVGDLLALFRCISCRFSFSTDIMQPRLLGAIGRVYTTSEPEVCGDVQKYDKQIYLRVSEAQRCRVHSTVVIPFFEPAERHRALGVIEVVKNDKGVSFSQLLENVIASLESVSLCTSDINVNHIEEGLKQWPADNDLHMFDLGFDPFPNNTSPMPLGANNMATLSEPIQMGSHMDGREKMSSLFNLCTTEAQDIVNVPHTFLGADAVGLQQSVMQSAQAPALDPSLSHLKHMSLPEPATSSMYMQPGSLVDLGERDVPGLIGMAQMNVGSMFQAMPPAGENDQVLDRDKLEELLHTLTANKFRKKRRGKMGSGKHLTYKDLQKHFGVGLKEAAAALGICATTLKRACRRNGIERWPSRHATRGMPEPVAEDGEFPLGTSQDLTPMETTQSSLSQPMIDTMSPMSCELDAPVNNLMMNEEVEK